MYQQATFIIISIVFDNTKLFLFEKKKKKKTMSKPFISGIYEVQRALASLKRNQEHIDEPES